MSQRCIGLLLLCVCAPPAFGVQPEYINNEAPPPESAADIAAEFDRTFEDAEKRRARFPRLRKLLDTLPPFWRDTELVLKPRLLNFDRDRSGTSDQVTFAIGSALEYRSGAYRDRISFGLTGYTTQKLHGPRDAGGLGLLRPVQTGFGVLGEAFANIALRPGLDLKLFRQALTLPYFNRQDSRMVPITHEAYLLSYRGVGSLQWATGHVTKIKHRDSDAFKHLSEAAGFRATDEGASLAGFRWRLNDTTDVGVINYQAWDFMNITYAEAHGVVELIPEIPAAISAQMTYQTSTGDELDGDFGTYTLGLRSAVSYRSAVLSFGGTYTDEDAPIRSPFGGRPSYLSLMIGDFDRAGEIAWLAGLSYGFGRFGIEGLAIDVKYANGYGHGADPDRDELDVTLSYKPVRNILRGLWLRMRYASLDPDDDTTIRDLRFIVDYELPLL